MTSPRAMEPLFKTNFSMCLCGAGGGGPLPGRGPAGPAKRPKGAGGGGAPGQRHPSSRGAPPPRSASACGGASPGLGGESFPRGCPTALVGTERARSTPGPATAPQAVPPPRPPRRAPFSPITAAELGGWERTTSPTPEGRNSGKSHEDGLEKKPHKTQPGPTAPQLTGFAAVVPQNERGGGVPEGGRGTRGGGG